MNNCSNSCLESLDRFGFVCRSFVYNDQTRQCILYDEDPMDNENKSEESVSKKLIESDGNLYRVLCSTNEKGIRKLLTFIFFFHKFDCFHKLRQRVRQSNIRMLSTQTSSWSTSKRTVR